jgi:hypothetical protein
MVGCMGLSNMEALVRRLLLVFVKGMYSGV